MNMTDEELDLIERGSWPVSANRVALIAQAREANALRSANAELRGEVEELRSHCERKNRKGIEDIMAVADASAENTRLAARVADLEKALDWTWASLLEGRSTIHELDCRRSHLGLDERPERECTCGYESARATKEKTA